MKVVYWQYCSISSFILFAYTYLCPDNIEELIHVKFLWDTYGDNFSYSLVLKRILGFNISHEMKYWPKADVNSYLPFGTYIFPFKQLQSMEISYICLYPQNLVQFYALVGGLVSLPLLWGDW